MIYKVFSDNENFNEVEFSSGINIILGVKNDNSNNKDTMNGVGKTTLLEIIDFCLGARANKDSYLKNIDYIKDWTFSVDMDLFNSRYIISRSIKDSNKIYIEGNLEDLNLDLEKDGDRRYVKLKKWNEYLGEYLFDLENSSLDYTPSFRSLISYFIRRRSDSFLNPFEHFSKQKGWVVQINTAFLLGLNWKCAANFQKIKDGLNDVNTQLKKFDKSSIGEMETKKINLEKELSNKNETLNSFNIHENYNEIEVRVNQLSEELSYLSNVNMVLKRKLLKYQESISNEKTPNEYLLNNLYDEIQEMFTPKTKKTLEDVRVFHNTLISNRKSFLNVEILEVKDKIKHNNELIEIKGKERSKLMKILDSHNALDEFRLLQEQIYDEKIKLNEIKKSIDDFNKVNKNKKELQSQKTILKEKIEREYDVKRPFWENAITLFDENTKFLYGESGELIIDLWEAYKFSIKFPKNESRGVSKMKIFCYDLMLLERNSDKNIDFLIHDSEIFTDVDSRQVSKALQLLHKKCGDNLQYIFTLNSNDLEKIKLELPDDFNVDDYVKLKLYDNDPKLHLLGTIF